MTDLDRHDDDPTLDRVGRLLRAAGPPPELSADLRARLLAIPRDEPPGGVAPGRSTWWQRFWLSLPAWRVATGGLALAAVVLAIVAIAGNGGSAVNGQNVALSAGPGYHVNGDAVSIVTGGSRRIRVRIDNLPPLAGSEVYELWIAKDPRHRVSIGVFRPGASNSIDTTVTIPNLGPKWQGIWLTHENGRGTPGWSRDWVVAGRLV
jgi:anti-sigma-K factor RskA